MRFRRAAGPRYKTDWSDFLRGSCPSCQQPRESGHKTHDAPLGIRNAPGSRSTSARPRGKPVADRKSDEPDKLTLTRSMLREAHGGLRLDLLGLLPVGRRRDRPRQGWGPEASRSDRRNVIAPMTELAVVSHVKRLFARPVTWPQAYILDVTSLAIRLTHVHLAQID